MSTYLCVCSFYSNLLVLIKYLPNYLSLRYFDTQANEKSGKPVRVFFFQFMYRQWLRIYLRRNKNIICAL